MTNQFDEQNRKHGLWLFNRGKFTAEQTYSHGIVHGPAKLWIWYRGLLYKGREEGHMHHGKKHGPWTQHMLS